MRTHGPTRIRRIVEQAVEHCGLSRRALASNAGIAPETLSRIYRRGTGDFATVEKLARAAGLELCAMTSGAAAQKVRSFPASDHQRLDARSLALHALSAGRLIAQPELLTAKILPTIGRFRKIHAGTGTLRLLDVWERAAHAGVNAVVRLCIDPSEKGRQLRQASPMTGLLLNSERRSVYDAYAT